MSWTSCAGQHFAAVHFPGVQDLAAQRHDRLELLVARLLGRAAGGVTLHQEQLGTHRVLPRAVGQLAGQRRALGDLLALDLLAGLEAATGVADGLLGQQQAGFRVGVEPQAEGVLDHARNEGGCLARGQALLGLAGELRLLHLHRQHEGDAFPDVFRGQLDPARQQVAELAELAHGVQQALAQAVDVGAALGGGDQVDVAFLQRLAAFRQPQQGPVHRFLVAGQRAAERLVGQAHVLAYRIGEVGAQAVLEVPAGGLVEVLVGEGDFQARAEHGLGLEHMLEAADGELRRVEVLRIGPEAHAGAGVALADRADHFQVGGLEAVGEGHAVLVAVTLDLDLDLVGQGVDHRDAHAVQAAGELVVLVGELAAGVQLGEDQLDAGDAFFRVDVHRHAAAVVDHFQRVVGVEDHLDGLGVAGQRFVDAVVDDFLGQVVGPRRCRCTCPGACAPGPDRRVLRWHRRCRRSAGPWWSSCLLKGWQRRSRARQGAGRSRPASRISGMRRAKPW